MCGPLPVDRFIVLRSLYLGLVFLPRMSGNLFGAPSPCIEALTNAKSDSDNILTRGEFQEAWTFLADRWCSATTSEADDDLFNGLCCSCMEYDVGRFDAWCCMKVTFADSCVGVRLPDAMYPLEYAKSLCDRIENRIRELHCMGDDSLPPEMPPPSESTRPTVSPMSSPPRNNQTRTSNESENGFMNKLGEAMILALCAFILILLIGGICAWMSNRNSNGSNDDESRGSATKSMQSGYARAAPKSEQPENFDDVRKGDQTKDKLSEGASPRRSRVERFNDTPDNKGGIAQAENQQDPPVDMQVESQFFL